jgi:hypothetical protein
MRLSSILPLGASCVLSAVMLIMVLLNPQQLRADQSICCHPPGMPSVDGCWFIYGPGEEDKYCVVESQCMPGGPPPPQKSCVITRAESVSCAWVNDPYCG